MSTPPFNAVNTLRYEAEALALTGGFTVASINNSSASAGQLITLSFTGKSSGTATGVFKGPPGTYQVRVGYFDENDGVASGTIAVAGKSGSFQMNQNLGADFVTPQVKTSSVTHAAIALKTGDRFQLDAKSNGGELARIDYIDFQRTDGGFIRPPDKPFNLSIEAEAYKATTKAGVHTWNRVSDKTASGQVVVQAGPDVKATIDNQHLDQSPRLDYTVNFPAIGTYQVWLRGKAMGDIKNSDSVHLGLDGKAVNDSNGIGGFGLPYRWTNGNGLATINITDPGVHTLNLWMREDGLKLDSLFVTSDLTLRPTEKQAIAADKFVDSIGVNTHLNYYDTSYGDFNRIKSTLDYLGVRHIRAGVKTETEVLRRINELYKMGIKVTTAVPYKSNSIAEILNPIKAAGKAIEAITGPNEPDIFDFSYQGKRFPNGVQAIMRDLYTAVKNDPQLGPKGQNVSVIQSALGHPWVTDSTGKARPEQLGDLSTYGNYGNSHNYFSDGKPLKAGIDSKVIEAATVSPGTPLISTEGGYHTATNVNQGQLGVSYDVHGRYMSRYVLEQFNAGYERSFIYELLDLKSDPAKTQLNNNFGLFDINGKPKPAAIGISNLITLLADPGVSFAPKQLNYTLQGLPQTGSSLLLQKRNGHFFLVLWNDADNWDEKLDKPIAYNDLPVKLTVSAPISQIRTYRPLTNGITPLQTLTNTSTVTLQVPDHPLVVELTPSG